MDLNGQTSDLRDFLATLPKAAFWSDINFPFAAFIGKIETSRNTFYLNSLWII